jgi:DNA-binding CsgD family transcriptional regulator
MTKKAKQRLKGLLTPKRDTRFNARDVYGRHVLDTSWADLSMNLKAMDPKESDFLKMLTGWIDRALARAGAFNSDEDEPDVVALADEAGLTLAEYEAVVMQAEGLTWPEIAKTQHVSPNAAKMAGRRGLQKLQQYVLRSA